MKSPAAIRKQIAKLKAQIAASEKSREKALRRILGEMQRHDLTLLDLRKALGSTGKRPARKKAGAKVPVTGAKVPVKYQDGQGNTWSGRGREPRWLTEAIANGRARSDFAV